MSKKIELIRELETIESAARLNGLALAKLQASCDLEGYPSHRQQIDVLVANTESLLNKLKILRLFCNINEN